MSNKQSDDGEKMKRDILEEKLQELQLKLIEVQTQIAAAPPKAIEDFKVAKGYLPKD